MRIAFSLVQHSVVLPDILVSPVEQLLVRMELVLEEGATKFLLDQSFALARMLPIRESHFLNNVVDVRDDTFHDDVRVPSFGFAEQFRQRLLGVVPLLLGTDSLFSFHYILVHSQDCFQEVETRKKSLFM